MADPKDFDPEAQNASGPKPSDETMNARSELEGLLNSQNAERAQKLEAASSAKKPRRAEKKPEAKDDGSAESFLKGIAPKEKKNTKKIIAISTAALLVAGVGGGAWFMLNAPKEGPSKGKEVEIIDTGSLTKEEEREQADKQDQFWIAKDGKVRYPAAIPDWSKKAYGDAADAAGQAAITKAMLDNLSNSTSGSTLYSASSVLPPESAGYTADDSKELLADGTLNPMYSFWTQEAFLREAGSHIQRLINPTFGGWSNLQYGNNDPEKLYSNDIFNGMYTDAWLKRNEGKNPSEYAPIFADWAKNNYGEPRLLAGGPRWFGVVQSDTADFVYNDETSQYTVNYTAKVKFSAFTKKGEVISRDGVLKLKFVPNVGGNLGAGQKVLIDESSLTIG